MKPLGVLKLFMIAAIVVAGKSGERRHIGDHVLRDKQALHAGHVTHAGFPVPSRIVGGSAFGHQVRIKLAINLKLLIINIFIFFFQLYTAFYQVPIK